MDELYIQSKIDGQWHNIELTEDLAAITFQRNDLGEFDKRKNDFCSTFKIPLTPNNIDVLGMVHIFNYDYTINDVDIRHIVHSCDLWRNGQQLINNGQLAYKSIDGKFAEMYIVSNAVNFYDKISGGKMLNNLNVTESLINSLEGYRDNSNENFKYLLADFSNSNDGEYLGGFNKIDRRLREGSLVPCYKYDTLINKIVKESGYSLKTDVATDIYVPLTSMVASSNAGDYLVGQDFGASTYTITKQLTKNKYMGMLENVWSNDELLPKANFNGVINVSVHASLRVISGNYWNLTFLLTAKSVASGEVVAEAEIPRAVTSQAIVVQSTSNIAVDEPCYLDLSIKSNGNDKVEYTIDKFKVNSYTIDGEASVPIGGQFGAKGNLPKISQADFFKEYLIMFGLTIYVDEKLKRVVCKKYNDIYDRGEVLNWSKKYQRGTGKMSFNLTNYAQQNIIKYKDNDVNLQDEGVYSMVSEGEAMIAFDKGIGVYQEFGGRYYKLTFKQTNLRAYYVITIEAENKNLKIEDKATFAFADNSLEKQKELYTLQATATETSEYVVGSKKIALPKIKWKDNDMQFNGDLRYLTDSGVSDTIAVYDETNTNIGNLTINLATTKGATMSELISNYDAIEAMFSDCRVVTDAEFLLNDSDVKNWKGNELVYIDNFGAYFLVNKISNYQGGGTTKCTLIKVR